MKKVVIVVFALCLLNLAAFRYQTDRIKSGSLIVLNHSTFVDLVARTITDKSSVFPITLWRSASGKVYARHEMIAYRAHVVADVPATNAECALYQHYF